jgi:multiple sugar transport system permease protein
MAVAAKRTRLGLQARSEERAFYLFISPWIIGFTCFTLYPVFASLYFSLNYYDVLTPPRWTGLGNYANLFKDDLFYQALKVTSLYALGSVVLGIAASLVIAIVLNRNIKGVAFYRTVFYLPSVISGVAVSLLWMWLFNPDFGLINYILWSVFRIDGPGWIYDPKWVIPSLIVMSLWGIGGGIVIYLARLQGIPTDLYEAAEIDGAGALRRITSITLPMMTPVIFFNLLMGIIGSFQVFTQAYVMTNGGPGYASLFYVLYLYRYAFKYYQMGYASALAWILFLVLLVLTMFVFRTSDRWVYYEGG